MNLPESVNDPCPTCKSKLEKIKSKTSAQDQNILKCTNQDCDFELLIYQSTTGRRNPY